MNFHSPLWGLLLNEALPLFLFLLLFACVSRIGRNLLERRSKDDKT